MTHRFTFAVTPGATELQLAGPSGTIPIEDWALAAPRSLLPGVDIIQRLRADEEAIEEGDILYIEHAAIARLTPREAGALELPPLADVMVTIGTSGVITSLAYTASIAWKRPSGQAIVGAERCGAWLKIGDEWRRLPDVLFDLAERTDQLRAVPAHDQAGRMAALAALREVLPTAQSDGRAHATGAINSMNIVVADAFSLDITDEGDASRLVPVLHRAGDPTGARLLPEAEQQLFGVERFNAFGTARPVYPLGPGSFVVLQPTLRAALAEVRRVQGERLATKRALLANPRAFLRQVLGDEADATVLENVFQETPEWSDRVIGLGLWKPRVLPWVPLATNDWFDGPRSESEPRMRQPQGLTIDGKAVPLTPQLAEELLLGVEAARARGEASVPWTVDGQPISVPVSDEVRSVLAQVIATRKTTEHSEQPDKPDAQHILIRPNEEDLDVEADWTPRPPWPIQLPACLRTRLKDHQQDGLSWLQAAWREGRPGTLLADDMGLGKTLQALAFLAWLREGMTAGAIDPMPLLIVAPTGLLENWRQEHETHLAPPGLGKLLRAYGKDLAQHRTVGPDGQPTVSVDALRQADWVLTTYETLRDYDRDFVQVAFAAAVFDEAQKIKTPGIRLTDAAKGIRSGFTVAMTGTPVENRLADLWCIVDTVHPGYLASLREFSDRFERAPDDTALRTLKNQLDQPRGGRPPLMKRRLRRDHLPDLPACEEIVVEQPMPAPQQAAYDDAINAVRSAGSGGGVLAALSTLRQVSLHPAPDDISDDDAFLAASARLIVLFAALDRIEQQGERALVFLDDRNMQARLAGLIQRRYRLSAAPLIINGAVPGAKRQAHVNQFQSEQHGFGVMILSPRAGGVGLTLTRANHAIHLERWWNPAVEDQCTGRVLRIGQTRPVWVHVPQAVCSGRRSFDQNLHALLERKRQLVRDTLGTGEMTEDDGRRLLNESIG